MLLAGLAATLAACVPLTGASAQANRVTCTLERAGAEFRGHCAIPCMVNALAIDIDGPNARVSCTEPPRRVAATLRPDPRTNPGPDPGPQHWLGTMEGKFPEDPTRFELLPGSATRPGVAKLPFGWFALEAMRQDGDRLELSIAADRTLPPTADDLNILDRATSLLPDASAWNRADDRTCRPSPARRSLFCALTEATTEVSGGVHYRQPALQMVREVLNEVGGTRLDRHRLMDYNNHPDTTLAEILDLLRTARQRLERRLERPPG